MRDSFLGFLFLCLWINSGKWQYVQEYAPRKTWRRQTLDFVNHKSTVNTWLPNNRLRTGIFSGVSIINRTLFINLVDLSIFTKSLCLGILVQFEYCVPWISRWFIPRPKIIFSRNTNGRILCKMAKAMNFFAPSLFLKGLAVSLSSGSINQPLFLSQSKIEVNVKLRFLPRQKITSAFFLFLRIGTRWSEY